MKKLIESLPEFKCRASASGNMMTNGRAKDTMGETCKKVTEEWLVGKLTGKRKQIESKYLTRGIAVEDLAIERIAKYYGVTAEKNSTQLENDYFTGEFDVQINTEIPMIIDAKSSWDAFTFPYFELEPPKGYYDQVQVYLALTGLKKGGVAFCLENGTDEEIERLSWKIAKKAGFEEPEIEHWDEAESLLNYDHLPDEMRIKIYEFDRDDARIEAMQQRVIECRNYIKNVLIPQLPCKKN